MKQRVEMLNSAKQQTSIFISGQVKVGTEPDSVLYPLHVDVLEAKLKTNALKEIRNTEKFL